MSQLTDTEEANTPYFIAEARDAAFTHSPTIDDVNLAAMISTWPEEPSDSTTRGPSYYSDSDSDDELRAEIMIDAPELRVPDVSRRISRLLTEDEMEAYARNPWSAMGKMFGIKSTERFDEFGDPEFADFFKVHDVVNLRSKLDSRKYESPTTAYLVFPHSGDLAIGHGMEWVDVIKGNNTVYGGRKEVYEVTAVEEADAT